MGSISTDCTIGCDIEWESDTSSNCDKLTSQRTDGLFSDLPYDLMNDSNHHYQNDSLTRR